MAPPQTTEEKLAELTAKFAALEKEVEVLKSQHSTNFRTLLWLRYNMNEIVGDKSKPKPQPKPKTDGPKQPVAAPRVAANGAAR